MQITPAVRSITEYHLALSEQDAREAVEDPLAFGKRVGDQLMAMGLPALLPTNGNGRGTSLKASAPKGIGPAADHAPVRRRKEHHASHRAKSSSTRSSKPLKG